jgi:hypothetical protein
LGPTELIGRAQVTFLPLSMFIGRLNLHFISVCFALKNCLVLDLLGILIYGGWFAQPSAPKPFVHATMFVLRSESRVH